MKIKMKKIKNWKQKIETQEDEFDVYSPESLTYQHDEDTITSAECGFMIGYLEA